IGMPSTVTRPRSSARSGWTSISSPPPLTSRSIRDPRAVPCCSTRSSTRTTWAREPTRSLTPVEGWPKMSGICRELLVVRAEVLEDHEVVATAVGDLHAGTGRSLGDEELVLAELAVADER